MRGTPLGPAGDVPPGAARPYVVGSGMERREVIVVHDAAGLRAFANACPHRGTPLNLMDDDLWAEDGAHLVCRTHGALFRPADGFCIAGPCKGASLVPLAVQVIDGTVVLLAPPQSGTVSRL